MKSWLSSFACGILFAAGLIVSGMLNPDNIRGFLDLFGNWKPGLAFVMLGGIAVHFVSLKLILKRKRPILDNQFHVPTNQQIDRRLIFGSILFGIGWGISGLCPGPALTSLGVQSKAAIIFVPIMIFSMWLAQWMESTYAQRSHNKK